MHWGVSILVWALRPWFSPIQWGNSDLPVIPLLRLIPRRGKRRQGPPPRRTPSPPVQAPRCCGDADGGRRLPPRPGAWSGRLGHLGPPATGGWGALRAAAHPPPRERSAGRARAAGSAGGAGARPRAAPHSPRSAPLLASASRRLRARPSAVQGSIARDGTGGARCPLAARSLLLGGNSGLRTGRTRAPPPGNPARRGPAPHDAPPRSAL